MSLYIIDPQADLEHPHLTKEDEHHLVRVKRVKSGEIILLTDNQGLLAHAIVTLDKSKKNPLDFKIIKAEKTPPLKPIIACLPILHEASRLEWAVEKLCELGVENIQLIATQRCQKNTVAKNTIARLYKIALAAQKQSHRTWPLEIFEAVSIEDIVSSKNAEIIFADWVSLPSQKDDTIQNKTPDETKSQTTFLIVGPEGGLTENETNFLLANGAKALSLGTSVLRSETALVCLAARLLAL